MDQTKVAKQIISFYKTTFDSSFNAMTILQEQTERMVRLSMEQSPWLPEEGKKLVADWVKAYKNGRDEFKSVADENYKKVDSFFNLKKEADVSVGGEKTKKAK